MKLAFAWHEWVYYILVAAVVVRWGYSKLHDLWRRTSEHTSRDARDTSGTAHPSTTGVSATIPPGVASRPKIVRLSAPERPLTIREHPLWSLLAAAFLAGVVHYELRLEELNRTLDTKLTEAQAQLVSMNSRLGQLDLDRLSTLRDRLDPAFNKIFGPHLEASLNNLRTAVRDKEMTIGPDDFRSLYVETLQQMRGHTLLALSYPTKEYFWDARMMEVVAQFVRNGGVMKRIFFLDGPALPGSDAYAIMNGQRASQVEVYYVFKDDVPRDKQAKFLVDANESFAWYVQVTEVGRIEKTIGTSDRMRCREYIAAWEYLKTHFAKEFSAIPTRR